MADDFDRAQLFEERERELSLAAVRRAPPMVNPTPGRCMNCGEVLPAGVPYFCDADCREDYQARIASARRNGSRPR